MTIDANDTIKRGMRAASILTDPLYMEAFKACEDRFIFEWRNAKDVAGRELAHAKLLGLGDVALEMKKVMERGQVEEVLQKRASEREKPRNPRG